MNSPVRVECISDLDLFNAKKRKIMRKTPLPIQDNDHLMTVSHPRAATVSSIALAAPAAPEWSSPPSSRTWACTTTSLASGAFFHMQACSFPLEEQVLTKMSLS